MKLTWSEDRSILVLCITMAFIIWFLNELNEQSYDTYDITVNYLLPEGKIYNPSPPAMATAQIEGRGWDFFAFVFRGRPKSIEVVIPDLPNHFISNTQIKDQIQSQILTSQLNVNRVAFPDSRFQLEELETREVPVRDSMQLSPSSSFLVIDRIFDPDSVEVSGPVSLLNAIDEWKTESLSITEIATSQEGQIRLQRPENPLIDISPQVITYRIEVDQLTQKRLKIPIQTGNLPDNASIFPKTVEVSFQTGLSQFDEIVESDFRFELGEIPTARNPARAVPVVLVRGPEVANITFSPKSVELIFVREN